MRTDERQEEYEKFECSIQDEAGAGGRKQRDQSGTLKTTSRKKEKERRMLNLPEGRKLHKRIKQQMI